MRGHESDVHSISIHPNGRFGATTSRKTAQLWDLDTFQRLRKLNVRIEIPILEVTYMIVDHFAKNLVCFMFLPNVFVAVYLVYILKSRISSPFR